MALVPFALLSEEGRPGDGNWGWGKHFATAVLFVVSADFVLRQPADWKRTVCLSILGSHALCGIAYIPYYFIYAE